MKEKVPYSNKEVIMCPSAAAAQSEVLNAISLIQEGQLAKEATSIVEAYITIRQARTKLSNAEEAAKVTLTNYRQARRVLVAKILAEYGLGYCSVGSGHTASSNTIRLVLVRSFELNDKKREYSWQSEEFHRVCPDCSERLRPSKPYLNTLSLPFLPEGAATIHAVEIREGVVYVEEPLSGFIVYKPRGPHMTPPPVAPDYVNGIFITAGLEAELERIPANIDVSGSLGTALRIDRVDIPESAF